MKRNALLIAAALFCLATSAFAADGKEKPQQQPQSTEQSQTAQTIAEPSKDQTPVNSDCGKKKKHKQKQQQRDSQDGLELWQSQLLYGGGG